MVQNGFCWRQPCGGKGREKPMKEFPTQTTFFQNKRRNVSPKASNKVNHSIKKISLRHVDKDKFLVG